MWIVDCKLGIEDEMEKENLVNTIGMYRNFVENVLPNTKINQCAPDAWCHFLEENNKSHRVQNKEQCFMLTMNNNIESWEKFLLPLIHQYYINCILHRTKYALYRYDVYDKNGFKIHVDYNSMLMTKCNNVRNFLIQTTWIGSSV